MTDTTTRALSLLNLLQTHRHWPGRELATRLGVTERTVRRDVDRLRELGYRIESSPGAAGGYRLEAGSAVPPLLLNDEEAVAMAVGLRIAAEQRLVGGPETTLTAMAKLEQVLPAALRRRVHAIGDALQPTGGGVGAPVSTQVLGELALACRDHERVRFTYTAASAEVSRRRVEPHVLAPADRHWYLLCWDLDRDDWRTFRVDRLSHVEHTRVLFEARALTAEQVEEFISVARSWVRQPVEADVVMDLPLADMRAAFGEWSQGAEAEGADRTRWPVGGRDFRETMYGMTFVPAGVEFTTDLAEPARSELREVLTRMVRALDAPPPDPRPPAP
ncbi:WYL domain-containing protein [Microbacterium sp. zg.Y625]|uniref:helix-turn-helix transcriptional regulator n=1 Tax=Microbacterium jiangjiandongii TaxID=3049071 RepID=UPI00214B1F7B|nr:MULTISPECIES: WYL domain-containing protein [unclassified Microbacterium]MCR2793602.1 WYL domain-containing protein [Microbacterium sp. zg.Y625]MCR2815795.1 WYL domain-containing protein [Microbacterium sp. zg.Y843]WIM25951.1 WYL domain-containing protein [Microbacterium sp. zg-Y625]